MTFFKATKYLKYILLSRHRKGYGIHSPFVFNLVSCVFRNKIDSDIVSSIEKVRKGMIRDRRYVIVGDPCSGSEIYKTNLRKVSDIARKSSIPEKYGVLLSNMAAEFGDPLIVELGTSLGISAMYMAANCSGTMVKTVEGCSAISGIALENIKKEGLKNIEVVTGSFDDVLPVIISNKTKPGLVFIDGNHRKEPIINYFTQIAEISDSKTVIIINDINSSNEMEETWNEIKQYEKVSLTIDLNKMGIIFFREGITHNNYLIRY